MAIPLSSLGGTEYEPGKTDKIDKILGIAHGNIWFYTDFGRLVALDLETGDMVKRYRAILPTRILLMK